MHKICTICGKEKELIHFFFLKNRNIYEPSCKTCRRKYDADRRKTIRYVIDSSYYQQHRNSKHRGHENPSYSKEELKEWLLANGIAALYEQWVKNNYNSRYKPSIDRIDNSKGYSFDNITLTTWRTNNLRGQLDAFMGRRNNCKSVKLYDQTGFLIKEFMTVSSAARWMGVKTHLISSLCSGRTLTYKGYVCRYKDDAYNKFPFEPSIRKKVSMHCLNGDYIMYFNSISDASRYINTPYIDGISDACLGIRQNAYGYKWKYLND